MKVTFTGADNKVNVEHLVTLTQKYPTVEIEWGILFSQSKKGEQRYPTAEWIDDFLKRELNCASHLCGKVVDDFMMNNNSNDKFFEESFNRIQLNFNIKTKPYLESFINLAVVRSSRPIILQANASNTSLAKSEATYFLFDSSGGRGTEPGEWPEPIKGKTCGYAGGLNPDNLQDNLERITKASNGNCAWIDMESGIRTDNEFDLEKVEKVLKIISR